MVKYVDLIKRLLDGNYVHAMGHPREETINRKLYKEVTSRVPELTGEDVEEIQHLLQDATAWLIGFHYREIKSDYVPLWDSKSARADLYECYHPEIGSFYMVEYVKYDGDRNYRVWSITFTRNRSRAKRAYEHALKVIKEFAKGIY